MSSERLPWIWVWLLLLSITSHQVAADPVRFRIVPSRTGLQLVRASIPFPAGLIPTNTSLLLQEGGTGKIPVSMRILSVHPGPANPTPSVRRALVTFTHEFRNTGPTHFELTPGDPTKPANLPVPRYTWGGTELVLEWAAGQKVRLRPRAPGLLAAWTPRVEVVEQNPHFLWHRLHFERDPWPGFIDLRLDAIGGAVAVLHLQNKATNVAFAPEIGWDIDAGSGTAPSGSASHSFREGRETAVTLGSGLILHFPDAALLRRGQADFLHQETGGGHWRYRRCAEDERVPMQANAWRRATIAIQPADAATLPPTLTTPHRVELDAAIWAEAYRIPIAPPETLKEFRALLDYHRDATTSMAAAGDDWGNVTGFNHGQPHGGAFGMNRLNHGPAILEEGWRSNDPRLVRAALAWCANFRDLSIWWGSAERGGTRYNNVTAQGRNAPTTGFMWRSDQSVNFCTKGYDAFWLAWEETGDPTLLEALDAQVAYAGRHVHALHECRNVGDVRDFVRLHAFTGDPEHLRHARRLYGELRSRLSTGHLFDQGGKPIDPDPPFIDDDQMGLKIGYAKPYILGYALNGLPDLLLIDPDQPDLRETIEAVADFLAHTVDPAGGWRYPHPRSSEVLISQGIEHAWQLTQAARVLGPKPAWLDAIETVLRARIQVWNRSGRILSGLGPWELATGKVQTRSEINGLYSKPTDRDPSRDHRDGAISLGSAPPEGIVYFGDVLAFYLQHRPASRLLAEPDPTEALGIILHRLPRR